MLLSVPSDVRHSTLLDILRKKIDKPWKKIRSFPPEPYSGSAVKVPYYSTYPPLSRKVTFMGTTLFPSMARLTLPQMNKQKLVATQRKRHTVGAVHHTLLLLEICHTLKRK